MICKRAKVHLLPVDSKMYDGTFETNDPSQMDSMIVKNHFYITTDEEIKEGWVLVESEGDRVEVLWFVGFDDGIAKFSENQNMEDVFTQNEDGIKTYRKIITSTDPKLDLPQLTHLFIDEYCKAGGKLKFKCWSESQECWVDKALIDLDGNIEVFAKYHPVRLFLRDDDSLDSNEIMTNFLEFVQKENGFIPHEIQEWVDMWIKENL